MRFNTVAVFLVALLFLPAISAQSPGEVFAECPGTFTGSTQPEQIHLQMGDSHDEMMAMWATDGRTDAVVEWSHSGGSFDNQGDSYCYNHDKALHMAMMTDLPLGEEISYRVGDGSTFSSEMKFTTIDIEAERFEWISIADHGMSDEGLDVSNSISTDSVARLVTISGDISYADGDQNDWDVYFETNQNSMSSIPWLTAVGNHENEPGYGFEPYVHRFDSDGQKESEVFWYSRDVPGVHMVFMSTEHSYDPGSEQYNWLEADLAAANSEDARAERPFIIIYGHKPMYSSNSYHGSEVELRDALEDLYVEHGVDLVIAGHDHFYERTHPVINQVKAEDAPIHLVIGIAGRSAYEDLDEPQPEWSAYRENNSYGWTRMVYDDSCRCIEFTHHRTDGSIGDTFTLSEDEPTQKIEESSIPGFSLLYSLLALLAAALHRPVIR